MALGRALLSELVAKGSGQGLLVIWDRGNQSGASSHEVADIDVFEFETDGKKLHFCAQGNG